MQISSVMLNNHDVISLIESYLDSANAEYQSLYNKIEIYQLDGELIIIDIDKNIISISHKKNKYNFKQINQLFNKLDELIN